MAAMKQAEFDQLREGDRVRHKFSGRVFIITGIYGGRVTAVVTADITQPVEWELVSKASYDKNPDAEKKT